MVTITRRKKKQDEEQKSPFNVEATSQDIGRNLGTQQRTQVELPSPKDQIPTDTGLKPVGSELLEKESLFEGGLFSKRPTPEQQQQQEISNKISSTNFSNLTPDVTITMEQLEAEKRRNQENDLRLIRALTELERRAAELNVPVEVFKEKGEGRKAFMERVKSGEVAFTEEQQQAIAQQIGNLTPEQRTRLGVSDEDLIDLSFALTQGLSGAVAGGTAGAIAGAKVAPFLGPAGPLAVPVLATAGAIGFGTIGAYKSITADARDNVEKNQELFKQAKDNLQWIITETQSNRLPPSEAVTLWNENLANLYASERNIKAWTQDDLDRFLSGGADEYTEITAYVQRIPTLNQQFNIALTQGGTSRLRTQQPTQGGLI